LNDIFKLIILFFRKVSNWRFPSFARSKRWSANSPRKKVEKARRERKKNCNWANKERKKKLNWNFWPSATRSL